MCCHRHLSLFVHSLLDLTIRLEKKYIDGRAIYTHILLKHSMVKYSAYILNFSSYKKWEKCDTFLRRTHQVEKRPIILALSYILLQMLQKSKKRRSLLFYDIPCYFTMAYEKRYTLFFLYSKSCQVHEDSTFLIQCRYCIIHIYKHVNHFFRWHVAV